MLSIYRDERSQPRENARAAKPQWGGVTHPLALTPPLSTAPSLLLATHPNEELTQSQASSGPELTFYVH